MLVRQVAPVATSPSLKRESQHDTRSFNKPFEHAQIRFDEMVAYMKDVAELKEELTGGSTAVTSHATTSLTGHRTLPPSTIHHPPPAAHHRRHRPRLRAVEERNLLSVAYKNVIGTR